jgi:hypothetical protein
VKIMKAGAKRRPENDSTRTVAPAPDSTHRLSGFRSVGMTSLKNSTIVLFMTQAR